MIEKGVIIWLEANYGPTNSPYFTWICGASCVKFLLMHGKVSQAEFAWVHTCARTLRSMNFLFVVRHLSTYVCTYIYCAFELSVPCGHLLKGKTPSAFRSQGDNECWLLYVLEMIEWNILAVYGSPLLVAARLTARSLLASWVTVLQRDNT